MEAMISFVDAYRDGHEIEPICRVLAIAPSTYHAHVARRTDPVTAPARVRSCASRSAGCFDEKFQVCGVRKVWRPLGREGFDVARSTIARLMRKMGLQGVIRGRRVRTTVSSKLQACERPHKSVPHRLLSRMPAALTSVRAAALVTLPDGFLETHMAPRSIGLSQQLHDYILHWVSGSTKS